MKRYFYSLALIFLAGIFHAGIEAKDPGSAGGQVLGIGADARAAAMGESSCAAADDANALYWNPAGLALAGRREVFLTHMNRLVDVRFLNTALSFPWRTGVLGLGVFSLYTRDTRREALTGNVLGHFMDYNNYLVLSYAKRIKSGFHAGISMKFISNRLDDYKSGNTAIDAGMLYSLNEKIRLGLNVQNRALKISLTGEEETLFRNIKAGIAFFPDERMTAALDVNFPDDSAASLSIGGEYRIWKILALRAGYRHETEDNLLGSLYGFSAGFGIRFGRYQIDYAFTPYGDLGYTTHRAGFGMQF